MIHGSAKQYTQYSVAVSEISEGSCTVLWAYPPGGAKDANAYLELVLFAAWCNMN